MSIRAVRWTIAVIGALLLLLVNGAWVASMRQSGGGGFVGGAFSGALVICGGLLLRWAIKSPKFDTKEEAKQDCFENIESEKERELPTANPSIWAYQIVADELEANQQDRGLWTRAFAEAEGDQAKTKAFYIRHRAAQLTKDLQELTNPPMVVRNNREAGGGNTENACHFSERAQTTVSSPDFQEGQFSVFSIIFITVLVALPLAYVAFMIVAYLVA